MKIAEENNFPFRPIKISCQTCKGEKEISAPYIAGKRDRLELYKYRDLKPQKL